MNYFPCDIPFMSDEELKENGINIPKEKINNCGELENKEAIEVLQRNAELADPELRGALDLAISALEKQEQNRWHSVAKEGNPKESDNYLVTLEKGKVMEDFYHVPDNEWSTASRIGCGIVAWKPLPEPYTEDET